MKKHFLPIMLLLVLALTSCSAPAGQPENNGQTGSTKPALTSLNRDALKTYSSTFTVQFEGPTPWKYQLKTRKSATLHELSLHIEGIKQTDNPGDIRLVTDGTTSWMIGPGTDQECVQFPNNQGMDPTLIYPETILPQAELFNMLRYSGEEPVAGTTNMHYSGSAPSAGGWQNVRVDTWQDKTSKALLKFNLDATGNDQIFGAGAGKLTARYEAAGLGSAAIEPVKGCEIGAPLPDGATKIVRFPGLASFESAEGVDAIRNFYQSRLPQENWAENESSAQSGSVTVLSYRKNTEGLEINLEALPGGGSKVKLIFIKNK